jgi:hypothetical protein
MPSAVPFTTPELLAIAVAVFAVALAVFIWFGK